MNKNFLKESALKLEQIVHVHYMNGYKENGMIFNFQFGMKSYISFIISGRNLCQMNDCYHFRQRNILNCTARKLGYKIFYVRGRN